MFKKLKDKKGFTLVELIVVLVILDVTLDDVAKLAEVTPVGNIQKVEWANGKISHVQYKKGGKTCDYWAEKVEGATKPEDNHDAGYTVK